MVNVEKCYSGWFQIWNETLIPNLIKVPKWFKSDRDLKEGDIVYFQKRESELGAGKWIVGQVENVTKGKDGLIREASIRYQNHSENHSRTTNRTVRKLVKLFSVDDASIQEEMQEVEDTLEELGIEIAPRSNDDKNAHDGSNDVQGNVDEEINSNICNDTMRKMSELELNGQDVTQINMDEVHGCEKCCCDSHCRFNIHAN